MATLCPLAENIVQFKIEGPAEIAGVGNGNPMSLEPFQADHRKLFYGKAMLILRTQPGKTGQVKVDRLRRRPDPSRGDRARSDAVRRYPGSPICPHGHTTNKTAQGKSSVLLRVAASRPEAWGWFM